MGCFQLIVVVGFTIWDLRLTMGCFQLIVVVGFTILELRFWIYEIKKALHILWTSIVNRNSKIQFDAIADGIYDLGFWIYD